MATLDTDLRRAVREHIERRGISSRRFGQEALGDAGFVASLTRGRSLRLDTADRVLAFLGRAPVGPAFRREVEAFLGATGTKISVLGRSATGDPSFVSRLRRGASPTLATVDRVRAWMAAQGSGAGARAIRTAAAVPPESARVRPSSPIQRPGEPTMDDHDSAFAYLSTREAAAALRLSPRTLDRYRVSGAGPVFHKFGNRVRYARSDLESWAAKRRRSSTSDGPSALRGAA